MPQFYQTPERLKWGEIHPNPDNEHFLLTLAQ